MITYYNTYGACLQHCFKSQCDSNGINFSVTHPWSNSFGLPCEVLENCNAMVRIYKIRTRIQDDSEKERQNTSGCLLVRPSMVYLILSVAASSSKLLVRSCLKIKWTGNIPGKLMAIAFQMEFNLTGMGASGAHLA